MTDFTTLPPDLPVPVDDGAAAHLPGTPLPTVELSSTGGGRVSLTALADFTILYCYPMTGDPNAPLPDGWDAIPGARGCTVEALAFRARHADLLAAGAAAIYGISTQSTAYQAEVAQRLALPFDVLSDEDMALTEALDLPSFTVSGQRLLKRLTMVVVESRVAHVFYPVFPPDRHADEVIGWLVDR